MTEDPDERRESRTTISRRVRVGRSGGGTGSPKTRATRRRRSGVTKTPPSAEFVNCGPSLTDVDIRAVERQLDVQLPESFKRFARRHNGGIPEPPFFRYKDRAGKWRWNWIAKFVPLRLKNRRSDDWEDVVALAKRLGPDLPNDAIPIAWDPLNNIILLGIRGKRAGKVLLLDWDRASAAHDAECGIDVIATRFDVLLRKLQSDPGDEAFGST